MFHPRPAREAIPGRGSICVPASSVKTRLSRPLCFRRQSNANPSRGRGSFFHANSRTTPRSIPPSPRNHPNFVGRELTLIQELDFDSKSAEIFLFSFSQNLVGYFSWSIDLGSHHHFEQQTKTLGINAINADHCGRLTLAVITFGLLLDGLSRHRCTRGGWLACQ